MSFLNTNSFQDRQAAAAKARKAMAEKFLSRPKYDPNDPAVLEREAKRRAVLEAREAREELARLEYEKKLERDARYAARKERKKKKGSAAERWG